MALCRCDDPTEWEVLENELDQAGAEDEPDEWKGFLSEVVVDKKQG